MSQTQSERIQRQLGDVLQQIQQEMSSLATDSLRAGDYYAHEPGQAPEAMLRMISPLARGADRLAARAALDAGYQLYVPMPFAQAEYEKDFTGSDGRHEDEVSLPAEEDLAEFRELLGQASGKLSIDGSRHADPVLADNTLSGYSYEAAGRFVVRHCDLLLAIWDGKPGNGRGGTAEIVFHAASMGVPIWWIHAGQEQAPIWIADIRDLPGRDTELDAESAEQRLQSYLRELILVPSESLEHAHGWIEALGKLISRHSSSSFAAYFSALPGFRSRMGKFLWQPIVTAFLKIHPFVLSLAAQSDRKIKSDWTPPEKPTETVPRYWNDLYELADRRANAYAARYRSGYVLTILLTALAPVLGAMAVASIVAAQGQESIFERIGFWMACLELADLFAIIWLVALSLGSRWHQRSIEYRLLAELYRKQQTLAPLGWSVPINYAQQVDDGQQSWIGWLFAASQRSAPLIEGALGSTKQAHTCKETLQNLIQVQLDYHECRKTKSLRQSEFFERWGSHVFVAVLVCVVLKIGAELYKQFFPSMALPMILRGHLRSDSRIGSWIVLLLGGLATVLPTISAAFVAIRSYAEVQLLAEQSKYMVAALKRAQRRVARLDMRRALASQELGAEAQAITTTMLHDLEGWGRLFRGKIVEAS